jgi:serine/threonine protein kinase
MSRAADEEMIGRNVAGKFLVEKFLGGGAMGAVYKAYQKSLEKHVAIKVLHREFVVEPSFVSRFEREAKAASLLDHVNLMRVLDYGREADGVCYIAMELLEGRSLYQVIKDDTPLADERIAGLIRQTLAGLAVAHEMGIIHRDLKPENIIVLEKSDDDGRRAELVKVCDFGMAKLITPENETTGPLSSEKLTSHGVVVGTPDYMSPEQGKGEKLDARSDIYAVGVILYQMLTGRLPFSAETPIATLLRHVIDEPDPPSEINPNVHPGLEAICLRALAKRRDDRFQTARDMRAEIRTVIEGRGVSMPSALPPARLTLGSVPDASFAQFDLRPPGVPKSLDLGPSRPPALTPPQSRRISALDSIGDEPAKPRKWVAPVAVALVVGLAAVGFVINKQRTGGAVIAPHATQVARTAPTSGDPTGPDPQPVSTGTTPSPATSAPEPEAAHAGAEGRGPGYATPVPASLTIHGAKPDPAASASAATTTTTTAPAFGVLAVPEVPRIEGASGGPAAPVTPPAAASVAPPPAAAPTETPFAHAKVGLGGVRGEKVAASDVLAALPSSRFDRCYKKALVDRGTGLSGSGSLHISIESGGHISSAAFSGGPEFASIGECIANAAIGGDIKHVEGGATGADIDLAFRPE